MFDYLDQQIDDFSGAASCMSSQIDDFPPTSSGSKVTVLVKTLPDRPEVELTAVALDGKADVGERMVEASHEATGGVFQHEL